ncbi:peroxiredoxin family protein [Flammeovirga yaeyamensis]|uniref:Peroxiredoxin family protein n=1 Tax=Flammeovirga yaeyamensis TaxID=367791 RepID=A0AAX1MXM5_9BACT|nr:redoxin domain-containing protein [Flammeovirga yaeyamensis]MBB3696440.1 peroxiredoxin [Flammeovirga yaeyamensis]NMF35119.1 peroxiredoxin family protein [Flammeovirga yaeyamensis]QWG00061.1 peroxiredoxin family protein [Flammeovirga yaeyamensis]
MHFFENLELRNESEKLYKFNTLQHQKFFLVLINDVQTLRDQQHLDLLKSNYMDIESANYEIYVICSLSENQIKQQLKKRVYPFPILSDPSRRIAKFLKTEIPQLSLSQRTTVAFDHDFIEVDRCVFMSTPQKHIDFIFS